MSAPRPTAPDAASVPLTAPQGWLGGVPVTGVVAIAVLAIWALVGLGAPLLAPHGESEIVSNRSFLPMGEVGLLGTDYLGRDLFSRLMYGARTTLALALAATAIAFVTGVIAGMAAGILGGRWDMAMSRTNDVFFGFPQIMLALIVVSAVGTSYTVLLVTMGLIEGTRVYRIARALAQNIMTMEFVQISRARGERMLWILWNDILPNAAAPLATDLGLRFTYSILLLSALSFLGLGVQPPAADWGVMVRENLTGLHFGAAAALMPALAIFSVTMSINHLVDLKLATMSRDVSDELMS